VRDRGQPRTPFANRNVVAERVLGHLTSRRESGPDRARHRLTIARAGVTIDLFANAERRAGRRDRRRVIIAR
jgi:hypothetical protein